MAFKWKSYITSVTVKEGPKQYGFYYRNKKKFFRNYHRELKNGKGLSLLDILRWKIQKVERQMRDTFTKYLADSIYPELLGDDGLEV